MRRLLDTLWGYLVLKPRACPRCGGIGDPILYAGLPGWMCAGDGCAALFGPALLPAELYFTGVFMVYDGTVAGYLRSLWCFLAHDHEEQ